MHVEAPSTSEIVPGGQVRQLLLPVNENFPGPHVMHLLLPGDRAKWPAGHGSQAKPKDVKLPASQSLQLLLPIPETRPGRQRVHPR